MNNVTAIDHLPPELLQKIFGYLSTEDNLNCSAVCTKWRDLVDFYKKRFRRHAVTRLKLFGGGVKFYTETEYLGKTSVSSELYPMVVPFSILEPICSSLHRLQLLDMPELDVSIGYDYLLQNAGKCTQLTHLSMNYVYVSRQGFTNLCDFFKNSLTVLGIRHLCLKDSSEANHLTYSALLKGLGVLKELTYLSLRYIDDLVMDESPQSILEVLAANSPKLTSLALPDLMEVTSDDVSKYLRHDNSMNLTNLDIKNSKVDNDIEPALIEHLNRMPSETKRFFLAVSGTQVKKSVLDKLAASDVGKEKNFNHDILDEDAIYFGGGHYSDSGCSYEQDWPDSDSPGSDDDDDDDDFSGGGYDHDWQHDADWEGYDDYDYDDYDEDVETAEDFNPGYYGGDFAD